MKTRDNYILENYCQRQKLSFYEEYFKNNNLEDPYKEYQKKRFERMDREYEVSLKAEYQTTYIKHNGETYTTYTLYKPKIEYSKEFVEPYASDPFYTSSYYNCYWHKVTNQYIQYKFDL